MIEAIAANADSDGISFKDNITVMKILTSLLENIDCTDIITRIVEKLYFWTELFKRKKCPRAFKSMCLQILMLCFFNNAERTFDVLESANML